MYAIVRDGAELVPNISKDLKGSFCIKCFEGMFKQSFHEYNGTLSCMSALKTKLNGRNKRRTNTILLGILLS